MTLLNEIGWWASAIFVGIFVLLIAGGIWTYLDSRRRRVPERILEFLSGKRDWVRAYEIMDALDLYVAETYTTLDRLEEEGAVISERRNDRVIHGKPYAQRYYKITGRGRSRPVTSENLEGAQFAGA